MWNGKTIGLAGLLGLASFTSCWNGSPNPVPSTPNTQPTQADLIAFHKQRAAQLDSLISAVASQWPGVTQTGTGIRLEWLDRTPQATKVSDLPKGTVLELHHAFALLDDRIITSWQQDGPLAFELGATDLPTGFHEIIGSAALGDSVRALIPPSRAWGMTGLPPDIPQEAVILAEMRIDLYRTPE